MFLCLCFWLYKHRMCVWGCLLRAVTVLSTHSRGQQRAMTSQACPWGPATTSCCPSWVRRQQIGPDATSLKNKTMTFPLCLTGRGFNNLSQVRMGRHIASGQLVAIKQTNLDECTEEEFLQLLVGCWISKRVWSFLKGFCVTSVPSGLCLQTQNEVLLSRLFRHPNLLTSRLVFSSCCQLWVLTPLMAYGQPPSLYLHVSVWKSLTCCSMHHSTLVLLPTGSADSLLRTSFPDGMSESLIAYLLFGVLKALEYLHHMGYVHRSVRKEPSLMLCAGDVRNIGLTLPPWLQRGEGQPHPAVRRGPRLPLGAPQCLQYDAWGEEDEGGVRYAPPQPCPAALAQPRAAATGQEWVSSLS